MFDCHWLIIPLGGTTPPINPVNVSNTILQTATQSSLNVMQLNSITPPPNYGQNAGYNGNCVNNYTGPKEEQIYWFHPDHLGSSSYITGADGEVTQNIEYFPSGEVFVENHNKTSNNSPYKFNGKELDGETGYYYYGARYYNPRVSLWLNVDPLAEKMPSWSPYNYTFNNPVKYTDPDGKEPFNEYDKNGKMIGNLGGNKIDFYHQRNGDTKVVSRQTGASNIIYRGESIIRGYTHRGKDVGWDTIALEYFGGSGPARSLFSDFNDSNDGPFASLDKPSSPYSSLARKDAMNSKELKGVVKMDYLQANPITANFDGYE